MAVNPFATNTLVGAPLTATGVKNKMIAKLLEEGASGAPISSHFQGLNRIAQSLLGGYQLKRAGEEEKENEAAQTRALAALLGGGTPPQAAPAMGGTPPAGFAPPAPPMAPPQNVSGPVPSDDPTMTFHPRQVAAANAPQGGMPPPPAPPPPPPIVWGDGSVGNPNELPPPGAARPTPSPAAPPGPMPGALPATSSAAPPDMQAKVAAMLNDPNPAVRQMGRQLGAKLLAERMKPPEYKFQVAGDRLYRTDPRGGNAVVVADATKAPDAIRVANEVLANPTKYGFKGPDDPALHEAIRKRLTGVQVAIDQRSEGAFRTRAGGLVAERFNKIVEAGHDAQSMVADLYALRDIGSRIQPGKGAQLTQALGPFAELAGVKIEGLDDLQAYQAIISKLAPRMRVAGSGATSDFEMRQFLAALPSLGNTPQGNEIITNTLDALQQHRIAAAEIASRALAEEITPKEAERLMRELPNPMELWKKSRGSLPSAKPSDLKKKYGLE